MILISYAMPEEKPRGDFPSSCRFVQTGIGKVLAIAQVAKAILEERPTLLISTGFCGGLNGSPQGALIQASSTHQWDFYLGDLDVPIGHGYGMHCPLALGSPELGISPAPIRGSLITGDRFVDSSIHISKDAVAVDMESAALALLARELQLPFLSLREVSDVADGPQGMPHQQFMEYISEKGPSYSEPLRQLVQDPELLRAQLQVPKMG